MRQRLAVLGGFALAMSPAAAGAESVGGSVTSFGVGEWLGLMLRLGLVVGVIWAAVYAMRWYTRRAGGERGSAMRSLDIVETRSLGPNRALHLVRIGGRAVLIGVTPERINALMQIDDPEVLDALELTSGGSSRPAAFGALLAGLGAGPSKSAQAMAGEAPRGRSLLGALGRKSTEKPAKAEQKTKVPKAERVAKASQAKAVRAPRRSISDRAFSALGFTPVETPAQTLVRMRAAQAQAQAAAEAMAMARLAASMPVEESMPLVPAAVAPAAVAEPVPAPRTSFFERLAGSRDTSMGQPLSASVAPSATQALRALSGYAAAQQSSDVATDVSMLARESRIVEAQRAIMAAQQKAS